MPTREEVIAAIGRIEPPATAAVLVPLVAGSHGWELLFEVRSQAVAQPGEVCFPGGHVEPGENPLDTALRESREELALLDSDVTPIAPLPLDTLAGRRRVQPVAALVAADALGRLVPSAGEVAEVFTVPVAWFRAHPPAWFDHRPASPDPSIPPILQGFLARYDRELRTRYWEYEGHGIWGMTARMIESLLTHWEELGLDK